MQVAYTDELSALYEAENALWRLRKTLGLAVEYTGQSAATLWRKTGSTAGAISPTAPANAPVSQPASPDTIAIAVAGDNPAQRYMLVELPALELAHRGNMLVQPEAREQFALWLANNTISEASERPGVGRRTVMDARHFCGVRGR